MKDLTFLTIFGLLCFVKSAVSYQSIILSGTLPGQTFNLITSTAPECNLTTVDISSVSTEYKSVASCLGSSPEIPTYYSFKYDGDIQAFTTVSDSLGNQGSCELDLDSSSTSRIFHCQIFEMNAKRVVASISNECDVDRQKCIKTCDKGSRSPACYRNCTALYNTCQNKVKKCDSERQKCIQVCDKGSRSPACYRNCTALYNTCKGKNTPSVKELVAKVASNDQCDTERQKCIKVCGNGSRSPACYRNCTSLYNECQEKNKPTGCDSKRQQCIKVCDNGSRSPACYRNCTALYNQCKNNRSLEHVFQVL